MAKKKAAAPATDTLLVELLTEELPPKSLRQLGQAFADEVFNGLVRYQLKLRDFSGHRVFATPRRLAVLVPDVLAVAERRSNEVTGPPVTAPPEAVAGFAKKHRLAVSALEQRDTPKGRVFAARVTIEGASLDKVLVEIVKEAVKKVPIPKLMRWGSGDAQFARPVHGLVMMHGKRAVPGDILGVSSGRTTLGHRFLSSGRISIDSAERYEKVLASRGRIIADFAERRERIRGELESSARGAKTVCDDALLDEITALVESPAVYEGTFDRDFLEVPPECLILSMQQHQKYVPLRDAKTDELLPRFLFVSNLEAKDPREIIHGNERVLRARLSDAKFFYEHDRKRKLEDRVEGLKSVVYHNKIGNQLERVQRIQLLAGRIAGDIGADCDFAERAAWLSKADLLTGMVGEFPELQGVMGRYYAMHDGEPKEVADAIEQHYRPRFSGDGLPEGKIACAVALADKLEALVGLFGIGQQPTGDKDPYGLRRAALGCVRVLMEKHLQLSWRELIGQTFDVFPEGLLSAEAILALGNFLIERIRNFLSEQGHPIAQVDAVLAADPWRLDLVPTRLEAVKAFQQLPEAESLAAANKRVGNILKQAQSRGESFQQVLPDALKETAERKLFEELAKSSQQAIPLYEKGDYAGYLKTFATLRAPVDAFFDSVMVMVEQESLRRNRLALLADLREKMNRVADISKLAVEK
jgi:glycyl-tRNA synthetase beta chain